MRKPDASLTRLLTDLEWHVSAAATEDLPRGTTIALPRTHSLTYIVDGGVGAFDRAGGRPVWIDPHERDFVAGDFVFSNGSTPLALHATNDARVVVVELTPASSATALALLPAALTVRDFQTEEPAVAQLAASMGCANPAERSSDSLVCSRIATVVMNTAIRTWVDRGCAPVSWLATSDDPYVARAVDAIHEDPAHPWTVGELATTAAMSRSVFASRFHDLVGATPAHYVASVRMSAAQRHLSERMSVAEVAGRLGYASEDGFSRAFRRHTGQSPARWREAHLMSVGA